MSNAFDAAVSAHEEEKARFGSDTLPSGIGSVSSVDYGAPAIPSYGDDAPPADPAGPPAPAPEVPPPAQGLSPVSSSSSTESSVAHAAVVVAKSTSLDPTSNVMFGVDMGPVSPGEDAVIRQIVGEPLNGGQVNQVRKVMVAGVAEGAMGGLATGLVVGGIGGWFLHKWLGK